jgi:hypothetical protein
MLESDSEFNKTSEVETLEGKNILHISDLITTASSYISMWIPAINGLNGKMKWTLTIVDRVEGGSERLAAEEVETYPLVEADISLFEMVLNKGIITKDQFDLISKYMDNPDETMKEFIINNMNFIEESLKGTGKTLIRVTKFINEDIYGLGELLNKFKK